ncbi:MAG: exosortase/archaeosortase family protein [Armatimonadetes bacterium]|nr:exosortase/archaeosortase family protein [Armatimonadota bacterium]
MASAVSPPAEASSRPTDPRVWAQMAVLVVLMAAVFGPTWAWAVGIWAHSEYYGHGFLVVLVSGFLTWRLLRSAPRPGGSTWPGLVLLIGSLALHLVGRFFDVWFPSGFAFVGALAGALWWLGGSRRLRHFWFPVVYLAFAVPLERFLVLQFAQPLQLGATTVASSLAAGAGLPVKQIGTTLQLPDYTFEVAIPCSGLKSSIAMSALGALMGFLVQGPAWARLLIFAASVPIALIANATRILLTLVLADAIGPGAAEGFFHTLSGLFVFVIAFLGLLVVSRLLKCTAIRSDI